MSGWELLEPEHADEVHVVPIDDIISHIPDCPCGPTPEPIRRDDGSTGWVVTHHSLDNREAGERTQ